MTQYLALGCNLIKVCLMLYLIWSLRAEAAAVGHILVTLHPVVEVRAVY
jgi:hypothetical protein